MKRVIIGMVGGAAIVVVLLVFVVFNKNKEAEAGSQKVSFSQGEVLINKGNFLEARDFYKKIIETTSDSDQLRESQSKLEELNMKILLSNIMDKCDIKYVVKPKDVLIKIAKKFNTTANLIKRANGLVSNVIRVGQELKVTACKFSIVVDKSQNILFLKKEGEVIKTFIVSTGKDNSTPAGNFKVVSKLENPAWFRAGAVIPANSPENILGSRWLGLDIKGYGIHGTIAPQDLGKQVTLGCVRMKNEDVELLYDIVPEGTEVVIVD